MLQPNVPLFPSINIALPGVVPHFYLFAISKFIISIACSFPFFLFVIFFFQPSTVLFLYYFPYASISHPIFISHDEQFY